MMILENWPRWSSSRSRSAMSILNGTSACCLVPKPKLAHPPLLSLTLTPPTSHLPTSFFSSTLCASFFFLLLCARATALSLISTSSAISSTLLRRLRILSTGCLSQRSPSRPCQLLSPLNPTPLSLSIPSIATVHVRAYVRHSSTCLTFKQPFHCSRAISRSLYRVMMSLLRS